MTYGLFTGALVMHYGAEKVGCLVIPAGPGNSEKQLLLMQDFRTHRHPRHAQLRALLRRVSWRSKASNPRKDLALRKAFVGAEPYTEETRRKIEQALGVDVYNSYGLSEMNGPGVAFECEHKHGMHLWEDHFLLEIVDPQTGEPLPDGQPGELVLTTLCREAMPLLRYRTRDITADHPRALPAAGARIAASTASPAARDDMLIVRGVNIYPQQIERVLMGLPAVGPQLPDRAGRAGRNDGEGGTGRSRFRRPGRAPGAPANADCRPAARRKSSMQAQGRTRPARQLPVSEGKAKRVIDNRSL